MFFHETSRKSFLFRAIIPIKYLYLSISYFLRLFKWTRSLARNGQNEGSRVRRERVYRENNLGNERQLFKLFKLVYDAVETQLIDLNAPFFYNGTGIGVNDKIGGKT